MENLKTYLCECEAPQHNLYFWHDPTEDKIYITVNLNNRNFHFLQKLKIAFFYLLGRKAYPRNIPHWDEFVLNKKTALNLAADIQEFFKSTKDSSND